MMSALNKGRAYDLADAYQAVIEKAYNWNEVFASHGMILDKISCPTSTRGRYMMLHVVLTEMPKGDVDLPTELKEFIASHAGLTGGRVMKVTMHAPAPPEHIPPLSESRMAMLLGAIPTFYKRIKAIENLYEEDMRGYGLG